MRTKRLTIRDILDVSDYKDLLSIYNSYKNMMYIMDGKHDWNINEIKEKWEGLNRDGFGFKIVTETKSNKIIGECGILKTHQNDTVEIAYMIDHNFWNRGYGDEIVKELIKKIKKINDVKYILAGMYKDNINSEKLVLKNGFILDKEGISSGGIEFKDYLLKL